MFGSALVENKWSMKVDFSENQPPKVEGKPLRCSFDISGYWTIIFTPTNDVVTVRIACHDLRTFTHPDQF
jgi:hypothetical protein